MPRKTDIGKAADQVAEGYFKLLCTEAGLTEKEAVALFNDNIRDSDKRGGRGTLPWALNYLNKRKDPTRAEAKRMLADCAGVTTQQAGNYLNGKTPTPQHAVVNVIGKLAERITMDEKVPYWGRIIGDAYQRELYADEFEFVPKELDTREGKAYSYAFDLLVNGITPFEIRESTLLEALCLVSELNEDELRGLMTMLNGFKPRKCKQVLSPPPLYNEYTRYTYADAMVERDQALFASLKETVDEIDKALNRRANASAMKAPGSLTGLPDIPFD